MGAARTGAAMIGPDDARYRAVVDKQFNKRWTAHPDYVRLTESTAQVATAVEEAGRSGRRFALTSGGHCLENFVSDPDVRAIIDVSPMKRITYDAERRAVCVEAGATVGETFRALAETWGTVIPLGEYPDVGMGGHVCGGAFGFLCRQLGLAADHLYAVEVVTVDSGGYATPVVATPIEAPYTPITVARSLPAGNSWATSASETANMAAPPMPCTAREMFRNVASGARPAASEATEKIPRPTANTARRPNRSASEPAVSTIAASDSV